MTKNLIKRVFEGALVGAFLLSNTPTVYAPPMSFNLLYESKLIENNYRSITENFKPKDVKKLHRQILSYGGETDTLWIPEYKTKGERSVPVSPPNCARYARFTAEDVFGLKYKYDEDIKSRKRGAWNYRYYNKIVAHSEEGFGREELESFIRENKLQPGMLIGIYNPQSNYNQWKDKTGKKVEYTHIAIFLGLDEFGVPIFANQIGRNTKIVSADDFAIKNWKFKEILDVPEDGS